MQTVALDRLRGALAAGGSRVLDEAQLGAGFPGARRGAVLALFYPRDGRPHVVLTRRTPQLRLHSGQVSLPGGRIDPLDFSPAEAALRETREELGIATDDLVLWGALEPVFTVVSNYLLIPFVGYAEGRPAFVPNPAEVAEVLEVPLVHLLAPGSVEEEVWLLRDQWRRVGFYRFGEHKIWGATARVLREIVALAGGPAPPAALVLPGEVEPEAAPARQGG